MNAQRKAMLVDIKRCIGCQSCVTACKQLHGFPDRPEKDLSATALTVVRESQGHFIRELCMHCQDPTCASACPVGALKKTDAGPVVYIADKCIGCRYCMQACPFQVPRYEWDKLVPFVKKCDLCAERVSHGQVPACVEVCPVQASQFGDREEILQEAHRRIGADSAYVKRIYGSEEVGGTSVFFISDVAFEQLGFPVGLPNEPIPAISAGALSEVPVVVTVGGAVLTALYWITQRRQEVALAEAGAAASKPARVPRGRDKEGERS
jgi:formate dehydrogenase iron-sulfur subunit